MKLNPGQPKVHILNQAEKLQSIVSSIKAALNGQQPDVDASSGSGDGSGSGVEPTDGESGSGEMSTTPATTVNICHNNVDDKDCIVTIRTSAGPNNILDNSLNNMPLNIRGIRKGAGSIVTINFMLMILGIVTAIL